MPSEWDLSTIPGWGFLPYERGPKVYRKTYAVNRERLEYFKKSKYTYPFELARKDVTDKYFLTSELTLPVDKMYRKIIKDKYVYIASAVRKDELAVADKNSRAVPDGWKIVDFGKLSRGMPHFLNGT